MSRSISGVAETSQGSPATPAAGQPTARTKPASAGSGGPARGPRWRADKGGRFATIDLLTLSAGTEANCGLHRLERKDGRPLCWTNGSAEIRVTPPEAPGPRWLEVRIWPNRQTDVTVTINGDTVIRSNLAPDGLFASVSLSAVPPAGGYVIRVDSATFQTANDPRKLGVAVETLSIVKPGDPVVDSYTDEEPAGPVDGFTKHIVDLSRSPKKRLITAEQIAEHASRLKEHLALDETEAVKASLEHPSVKGQLGGRGLWQRISLPHGGWTTSPRVGMDTLDPGWLNTLCGALTKEEGALLRPMPKWAYLKPILPDMKGKSVLDIGCNNGFFSFAFSEELGAARVTGLEVVPEFYESAQWLAKLKGVSNVEFKFTDALLDLTIPKHDIVFMSEVHGHFVDPLFGILRALNLSNETVVIDGAAGNTTALEMHLGGGIDPVTGKLTYHAWTMSDGMFMSYLTLCGVEPERVTRYIAPWPNHICYVIDTRGLDAYRAANAFQPCNTSFVKMDFVTK